MMTYGVRAENIDYQKQVIDWLRANGWQPYGSTISRRPDDPEDAFYNASPGKAEAGFRPRYRLGAWRCTVGPRTVYFYRPRRDQAYWEWDGVRFRTTAFEEIKQKAMSVTPAPQTEEDNSGDTGTV